MKPVLLCKIDYSDTFAVKLTGTSVNKWLIFNNSERSRSQFSHQRDGTVMNNHTENQPSSLDPSMHCLHKSTEWLTKLVLIEQMNLTLGLCQTDQLHSIIIATHTCSVWQLVCTCDTTPTLCAALTFNDTCVTVCVCVCVHSYNTSIIAVYVCGFLCTWVQCAFSRFCFLLVMVKIMNALQWMCDTGKKK